MASANLTTAVGPLVLSSPLIAASGTVGSVWEWAEVADVGFYGAAVAKSVAPEPWAGRTAPRMAPTSTGMLNGIGIENPGVDSWVGETWPRAAKIGVPIWGSAVAGDATGFALVAKGLATAGVVGVEVNLSCPNLEDGQMFSFDAARSEEVMTAVTSAVSVPIGAKLSRHPGHRVRGRGMPTGGCRLRGAHQYSTRVRPLPPGSAPASIGRCRRIQRARSQAAGAALRL